MPTFDDEYLEVFGGDQEVFDIVAAKIRHDVFEPLENEKCSHANIESFPDGQGYCTDCGVSFRDVSRIRDKSSLECLHENTYEDDNGLYVCRDCNSEIEVLDFEPEWRYYGSADNRSAKNPERCHRSRSSGRGIRKVFEEHQIDAPDAIVAQVESKYEKVVGEDTVRGKGRKAIIAACLFHAYTEFGEYRTTDYVRNLFKLTKKQMSGGTYEVLSGFPRSSNPPHPSREPAPVDSHPSPVSTKITIERSFRSPGTSRTHRGCSSAARRRASPRLFVYFLPVSQPRVQVTTRSHQEPFSPRGRCCQTSRSPSWSKRPRPSPNALLPCSFSGAHAYTSVYDYD